MKIVLTKEQEELHNNWNIICTKDNCYYYMPFILSKPRNSDSSTYSIVNFKEAPFIVRESIAEGLNELFLENIYSVLAKKAGLLEIGTNHWVNENGEKFTLSRYGFVKK